MALNLLSDYLTDSDNAEYENFQNLKGAVMDNETIIRNIIDSLLLKIEKQQKKSKRRFFNYRNAAMFDSDDDELNSSEDEFKETWFQYLKNHDIQDEFEDSSEDENFNSESCLTKGELTYKDLPKIEKLQIQSPVEQLTQIGNVLSIVDLLVVVQSFKTIPPLDLDSVLFLKTGSELGQIFDVIGAVKQPNYVIRFNSIQEIENLTIEINTPVYYNAFLPQPYTQYVFMGNLVNQKGSDASWKHNNEPPSDQLDYSDDETEKKEKWKQQAKSRNKNI